MNPVIRDYELLAKLGCGASATVWHAIHRGWKPCALKVFDLRDSGEQDVSDPERAALFRSEVRTAMSFSHGSVVQVFDAGEEQDGRLWMACEWVDGVNLHVFNRHLWSRGGKWPLDLAAYVIGRLLVALSYIHEFAIAGRPMNVVHRDVKPGNVLVSSGGEVKLTDFGVARMWRDDSHDIFRGTVRYVSIEHLHGHATQGSDLFGAGALFHELLANAPFRAECESPAEVCRAIMADEDVGSLDVPAPLEALRKGLLAPSADRFPSARAAHALLMQWPHYRPGELGLAAFFRDVMGRGPSSGATMHEGNRPVPESPLPVRFRQPTLELGALVPDADAPVAYRRPHTEFLSDPIAQALPADDSSAIRVRIFARKPLDDEPTTQVPPKLLP